MLMVTAAALTATLFRALSVITESQLGKSEGNRDRGAASGKSWEKKEGKTTRHNRNRVASEKNGSLWC